MLSPVITVVNIILSALIIVFLWATYKDKPRQRKFLYVITILEAVSIVCNVIVVIMRLMGKE